MHLSKNIRGNTFDLKINLKVTSLCLFLTVTCLLTFLYRLMASLTSPVPSPLAWLPCGFAVGPSRLCEGRLGLWWVGHSLEAGALLGSEGDTEWAWKVLMTHSQESELTVNSRAVQTNDPEAETVH